MLVAGEAAFGHYGGNRLLRSLIRLAQNAPRNWLGQQLAQVVRKLVLWRALLPLDVDVERVKMRVHLHDNNSERKFVFMPWRFDARERRALVDFLPRDGLFVDIGANVGIYTLTVASRLGAGGRVLALEPNPAAFERLRFNVQATRQACPDWPIVDLLQVGVGGASGEFDLHLDPANLGGSSIAEQAVRAGSPGAIRIRCQPLTDILDEQSVRKVDALKIDIEGAEDVALLPYLQQVSDENLPGLIVIENSEHLWKHDLVGALRARGYAARMRTRMNTVYCR